MKLYNRIMLGEGGRYVKDCLDNNYIGVNFLKDIDLSNIPHYIFRSIPVHIPVAYKA